MLRSAQVLAIVVSKVIVAHDGCWLDASGNQKIHEDGFNLGLTRFEVVSSDEDLFLLGKFNYTRNKSVLRATIDVTHLKCEKYLTKVSEYKNITT